MSIFNITFSFTVLEINGAPFRSYDDPALSPFPLFSTRINPFVPITVWVLDLSKRVDDGDIDDDESSFDPTDNESVEFLIGAFSGVTNGKLADEYIDFVEYSVVS
jgi:hypothetical protein